MPGSSCRWQFACIVFVPFSQCLTRCVMLMSCLVSRVHPVAYDVYSTLLKIFWVTFCCFVKLYTAVVLVLTTCFLRNKRSLQRYCRRFLFVVSCVNVDAESASGNGHTYWHWNSEKVWVSNEYQNTKGPDRLTVIITVWCKNAVKSVMTRVNTWCYINMLGFSFPSPQKTFFYSLCVCAWVRERVFVGMHVCVLVCVHACVRACVRACMCV